MAHKSLEELLEKLEKYKDLIGSRYHHYKDSSKIYIIRDIVLIEADEEIGIVYSPEESPELKWLRPFNNFFEKVEIDGQIVRRFIQ